MEFNNGEELLLVCETNNMHIWEVMLEREVESTDSDKDSVLKKIQETVKVMKEAIEKGIKNEKKSLSGLIGGEALQVLEYAKTNNNMLGYELLKSVSYSLGVMEVNSLMGRVVAAPTAGSCGVLPASLISAANKHGKSDDELSRAILTASAIGYIVTKNATVSGAEGGCQAEIGTATAMAAAGVVELLGGSPDMVLSAAAFSFKNIMGLVCDPIAGLVECPCSKRNALGVLNAFLSSDLALAGIKTIIPFDEVVDAMYKVGRVMSPDLKETAKGGIADTKTGRRLMSEIFG